MSAPANIVQNRIGAVTMVEPGVTKKTIQTAVAEAVAADQTVTDAAASAAASAVTAEIAGRDLVEAHPTIAGDVGYAVTDETGRLTAFVLKRDGDLHPHAVKRMSPSLAPSVMSAYGVEGINSGVSGWVYAITDQDGRVAFGVRADGSVYPATGDPGGGAASGNVYPSLDWVHWGDSLTAAGAAGGWITQLATLTGRSHSVQGIGGQTSEQIAARQGGVPARVTLPSNQIPSSGPVTLTSISRDPLGGSSLAMPGTIAGVAGSLAQAGGSYTFTRTTPGDAVGVDPGTFFLPDAATTYAGHTCVIWAGTNDNRTYTLDTAQNVQAMIDYLTPRVTRVMVLEPFPNAANPLGAPGRASFEAMVGHLETAFRAFWVPIGTWLRSQAAADAVGITFTAQDQTDITNGVTPTSFRSDDVHLNATGQTAVAKRIYDEAVMRGWV